MTTLHNSLYIYLNVFIWLVVKCDCLEWVPCLYSLTGRCAVPCPHGLTGLSWEWHVRMCVATRQRGHDWNGEQQQARVTVDVLQACCTRVQTPHQLNMWPRHHVEGHFYSIVWLLQERGLIRTGLFISIFDHAAKREKYKPNHHQCIIKVIRIIMWPKSSQKCKTAVGIYRTSLLKL